MKIIIYYKYNNKVKLMSNLIFEIIFINFYKYIFIIIFYYIILKSNIKFELNYMFNKFIY